MMVHGVYAGPESVTWLTEGIKTLAIPVTVPGIVLDPLKSVSMTNVTLDFTQTNGEWSPLLSTDTVHAAVEIPFGFPFGVDNVGGSFDILYGGQVNALVSTASGDITVKGIPINLDPALALQAFQRLQTSPVTISGLDVTGGTKDYIIANVDASIVNPSQVHAIVGDVRMQVDYDSGGSIGDALVRNANIPQGAMTLPVEAQLKLNSDIGRRLIKDIMTRGEPDIQALAHGTSKSTSSRERYELSGDTA
ncbi:hypothetical protein EX895_002993 [Sporisorium graminicola]|uniref:Uncharacterized protein n=1 Tax=Sporisorium graminicola TaxID=280036 RepID=A0A4U7KUU7_9BASI|nr:hypothetical protein EX895_002993 [Sporisorium graminicola]TKY87897.1 hypothetical protein EX895_002993 [Sporisorium graminicola]